MESVNSELEWELWRPGGAQCLVFQPHATFLIVLGYSMFARTSISYTITLIFICTIKEHQGWLWQLCILLKTGLLQNFYSTVVALYLYQIPLWVPFYFIVFYLWISPNYYYECVYQRKEGCSPLNLAGWRFCSCYFQQVHLCQMPKCHQLMFCHFACWERVNVGSVCHKRNTCFHQRDYFNF